MIKTVLAALTMTLFISVNVFAAAEKEPNNTIDKATAISLNTEYGGRLAIDGDTDWYKFTLKNPGYVWASFNHDYVVSPIKIWKVDILNSKGTDIAGGDSEQKSRGNDKSTLNTNKLGLPAGTYYVRVSQVSSECSDAAYRIKLNYVSTDKWEKEENQTMGQATPVDVNSTTSGTIYSYSDTDHYKVTLKKGGNLWVDFSHDYYDSYMKIWGISLLDANGKAITEEMRSEGVNTDTLNASPGTYYIRITNVSSDYSPVEYKLKVNGPDQPVEPEIYDPVKITKQPSGVTVAKAGKTASVKLTATGTGLKYTWYEKKKGASSFTKSKVSSSDTYKIKVTKDINGMQVYCLVKDSKGKTEKSKTVKIGIRKELKITKQPSNVTVKKAGNKATVKLTASGDGLTYQWYIKTPGSKKYVKAGSSKPQYSMKVTKAKSGTTVYCKVKDKYGNTKKSNTVTLKIPSPVKITKQIISFVDMFDRRVYRVKMKIDAMGEGLTYQWYLNTGKGFSLQKTYKKSYCILWSWPTQKDSFQVYCIVKDKYGNTVKSKTKTVKHPYKK